MACYKREELAALHDEGRGRAPEVLAPHLIECASCGRTWAELTEEATLLAAAAARAACPDAEELAALADGVGGAFAGIRLEAVRSHAAA
ncbi:MAG: hypothetical protein L0216_14415, partial [Planctomycetales bacterium]|nr:hypothetical protein [Planctomycetales bacterium]